MRADRMPYSKTARRTVLLAVTTLLTGLVFALTASQAHADWTASTNLASAGQRLINPPAIAYDATGRAYAVWTDYRWPSDDGVYLRERPPGGPWGAPQLLPTAGTGYVRDLVLSVNAAGDVVLVWRGGGITAMRRPAGGAWTAQQTWSSPGSAGANSGCPNKPVAAIGDNGSIVVAWTSYQSCNGNVSQWRVMATRYSTVSGWETSPTVWAQSPVDVNSTPAVAIDANGSPVLAFTARNASSQDQLWTVEASASDWDSPVMRGSDATTNYAPDIATRGSVTALGWLGTSAVWGLVRSAGGWGSAQPLPGGSAQGIARPPSVAVGAAGRFMRDGRVPTAPTSSRTSQPAWPEGPSRTRSSDGPGSTPSRRCSPATTAATWSRSGTRSSAATGTLSPLCERTAWTDQRLPTR
jgi:hypothetical protein